MININFLCCVGLVQGRFWRLKRVGLGLKSSCSGAETGVDLGADMGAKWVRLDVEISLKWVRLGAEVGAETDGFLCSNGG